MVGRPRPVLRCKHSAIRRRSPTVRTLLLLVAVTGCSSAFHPPWTQLELGAPTSLPEGDATTTRCSALTLERDDSVVLPAAAPREESGEELDRLTSDTLGTAIAMSSFRNGATLTISSPTLLAPTPITYDNVHSLRMIEDGDALMVVYTEGDELRSLRMDPKTGKILRPQRVAVAKLPTCKPQPRITDAVVLDGLTYVAIKASAMGEHGPCGGFTEQTFELAATVVISPDGSATAPMVHPRRDAPTQLGVVDGAVVGTQGNGVGFRVRCADTSAP